MEIIEVGGNYKKVCPFRTITVTYTIDNKMFQEIKYPECYYGECDFYDSENSFCALAISKLTF